MGYGSGLYDRALHNVASRVVPNIQAVLFYQMLAEFLFYHLYLEMLLILTQLYRKPPVQSQLREPIAILVLELVRCRAKRHVGKVIHIFADEFPKVAASPVVTRRVKPDFLGDRWLWVVSNY